MNVLHKVCWMMAAAVALEGTWAADAPGGWVDLFDGRTLTHWRGAENSGSFRVVDGAIAAQGPRAHLFYEGPVEAANFRNFDYEVEVKTRPGANSGIYFHTRYQEQDWPQQGFEIQVNNSQPRHGDYLELKMTGSLYGIRNLYKALVRDEEWFRVRVTVRWPRVEVRLNDVLVVDHRLAMDPTLPEAERVLASSEGTFAFQCHDPESQVFFRNVRVRPLPASAAEGEPRPVMNEAERQVLELGGQNFPVLNLHAHLKGGLTMEELLAQSRQTGIFYGIAVNCGLGFAVTNDAGVYEFVDRYQGVPAFLGMQGEGREWVSLFSAAARSRFDYVFTDALTFTDAAGRRTRLWIPEEVKVDDKEAFMEHYVDQIVGILETEPIDIFVNPTFLPEVIAGDYDRLWTPKRMSRIIEAAKARRIAIEINARYRIPGEKFIRLAKEAGVKFTFGTNNGGRDVGSLSYCFEMQRRCGLTWEDMFVPGRTPRRP